MASNAINVGIQQIRENRISEAINHFKSAIDYYPTEYKLYQFYIHLVFAFRNKFPKELQDVEDHLQSMSTPPKGGDTPDLRIKAALATTARAELFMLGKDDDDNEQVWTLLDPILNTPPTPVPSFILGIKWQARKGQFKKSWELLNKALSLYPNHKELLDLQKLIQLMMVMVTKDIAEGFEGLKNINDFPESIAALIYSLLYEPNQISEKLLGDLERSIKNASEAVRNDPTYLMVHFAISAGRWNTNRGNIIEVQESFDHFWESLQDRHDKAKLANIFANFMLAIDMHTLSYSHAINVAKRFDFFLVAAIQQYPEDEKQLTAIRRRILDMLVRLAESTHDIFLRNDTIYKIKELRQLTAKIRRHDFLIKLNSDQWNQVFFLFAALAYILTMSRFLVVRNTMRPIMKQASLAQPFKTHVKHFSRNLLLVGNLKHLQLAAIMMLSLYAVTLPCLLVLQPHAPDWYRKLYPLTGVDLHSLGVTMLLIAGLIVSTLQHRSLSRAKMSWLMDGGPDGKGILESYALNADNHQKDDDHLLFCAVSYLKEFNALQILNAMGRKSLVIKNILIIMLLYILVASLFLLPPPSPEYSDSLPQESPPPLHFEQPPSGRPFPSLKSDLGGGRVGIDIHTSMIPKGKEDELEQHKSTGGLDNKGSKLDYFTQFPEHDVFYNKQKEDTTYEPFAAHDTRSSHNYSKAYPQQSVPFHFRGTWQEMLIP